MKTRHLILSTIAWAAACASAAPAAHLFQPDRAPRHVAPKSGQCPDFSGNWKGECNDGSNTTATITQSECNLIAIDSQTYHIGGLHGESDFIPASATEPAYGTSMSRLLQWNKDGKTLDFTESFFTTGQGDITNRVDFKGTVSLQGEELHVHLDPGYDCQMKKQ